MFLDNVDYHITTLPKHGVVRLLGGGIVQGFDNYNLLPMEEFCREVLEVGDLHLRAFDRMGNEVNKTTLLEDLQANRSDIGRLLHNRLIRFIENCKCKPHELIQKIKLQLGVQQYEITKRLHFETESPLFKKSLEVFKVFCSHIISEP